MGGGPSSFHFHFDSLFFDHKRDFLGGKMEDYVQPPVMKWRGVGHSPDLVVLKGNFTLIERKIYMVMWNVVM
jgi:hypothetical protein